MSDVQIPIEIKSDEKGYYDRQCPNTECEYVFKIHMEDWKEKVSDEVVYCPMCGYTAESDQWFTDEQVESMKEIAQSYAMNFISTELNKTFSKFANSTRGNKYVKVEYKPGKKISFVNNPVGQQESWELDITCEECGTRYSVIGSAYFCPCCGNNPIERVFEESLDTIEKMLEAKESVFETLSIQFGKDKADTMCRTMLEGSLGDIVSAFQKYAKERFIKIATIDCSKIRVNDFQIVSKGSELFKNNISKGYDSWISQTEMDCMSLMFQRRHIVEHNNGIIDDKYLKNSNDISYSEGQRLIVKEADIKELLGIIRKLGKGLKELK